MSTWINFKELRERLKFEQVLQYYGVERKADRKQKKEETNQGEFEILADKNEKSDSLQPEKRLLVNAPLDFELKRLDQSHPYLTDRGFTRETIGHFGLGYCAKGYHV